MRAPRLLRPALAVASGGLALLAAPAAEAGPPYVTDDPEPTDPAGWEIYGFGAGTSFSHALDGEAGLDLNYGAAKDLQASATLSFAYEQERGERVHTSVADTEVGLKYRFLHQRDGSLMPDVALFPKLELPTAGRRHGSGKVGFQLPVWAQKDLGGWSLFGGGGYQLNPGRGNRDFTFEGLAVTREVTKSFSLGGELYHQSADSRDTRASTGVGVGASWQVAPHWALIGSGGPLIEHRASAGRYAFYLALAFHG